MFSDIAGVRTALKERLAPSLPGDWAIEKNLKQPPTEYRAPLLTFEFTRFDGAPYGQQLATGQVGALVDMVLGSPKSTDGAGEDDVDQIVLTVINLIEAQSDIFWDSADKQRLETGQWVWRIHTAVITSSKE